MRYIQSLERRTLLSTVSLLNGILNIEGTAAADTIYVTIGAGSMINILDSGVNKGSFALGTITKIIFHGGEGNDAYSCNPNVGAIPSYLQGDAGNDNLYAGGGNDTIIGNAGLDLLTGNGGNDYMDGGDDNDNVGGGIGNDTILGGDADDLLTGGDGNDLLDGGFGADRFNGGTGTDTATYESRTGNVIADISSMPSETADDGEANEKDFLNSDMENILGGSGNDLLTGTTAPANAEATTPGFARNNILRGNAGNDTIQGLDGNDILDGGLGTDILTGGDGNDTADYASRAQNLTLDLDGVADDGAAGENDRIDTDIENLAGGSGSDRLAGNASANLLRGNAGNDTIDGGLGADTITGNAGTDTADYSTRSTSLTLDLDGVADDGAAGEKDQIDADLENLLGGSGADTITGSSAANLLRGNGGNDSINGGTGNDVLDGGLGADALLGGAGNDTADYSSRTQALTLNLDGVANDGAKNEKDRIGADVENLTGGKAADVITGNAAANILRGGAGNDVLNGGDGADKLYGDAGANKLNGQGGSDILYARSNPAVKDILDGGLGADKAQVDTLDTKTGVETLLA